MSQIDASRTTGSPPAASAAASEPLQVARPARSPPSGAFVVVADCC